MDDNLMDEQKESKRNTGERREGNMGKGKIVPVLN
jgi:hypothetical protein